MATQVEQPIVYVGARDPESIAVVITATPSVPDLTVVESVILTPIFEGTAYPAWETEITAQSAKSMTVVHRFALTDLSAARIGAHTLEVDLAAAAWANPRRCAPKALIVRPYRATL